MAPKNRPYQLLRIPDGAPIELKPAAGKGWGMFATRDIARNECILEETPLFKHSIVKLLQDPQPPDYQIMDAVVKLPEDDRRRFLSLWHNSSHRINNPEELFHMNCFDRDETDDLDVLLLMARFNHSCVPNANMPVPGVVKGAEQDTAYMYASVDIPAGTEVTFPYGPCFHYLPRAYRQSICAPKFECRCPACSHGPDDQLYGVSSDRPLPIDKEKELSIISDPGLRKDAIEDFEILNSSRFIYLALIPCFLEAEGLLDDITSDRCLRDVKLFGHNFLEPYNAPVAGRAMEQETWVGRANYAWQLWNRTNACDPLVAYDLREVNEREEPEENGCHPGRECQCDAAYWDGIEAIECYSREVD
ncbi:SET domain-containing protein [Apiospora saccharicola]|uniref:SET domain-containing protein n=1 Tax=Apiospora saccharicola TaxID=335842 RepID=A0ABR1UXE9_9PEZI